MLTILGESFMNLPCFQPTERNWLAMVGHLPSPLSGVSMPGRGQCGDLDGAGGRPWEGRFDMVGRS